MAADVNPARQTDAGEQDRLVLGIELVLITGVFTFFGWLIDRAAGTTPVFAVVLGGFAFAYTVWKIVHGYNTQLAAAQQRRTPLKRGRPT